MDERTEHRALAYRSVPLKQLLALIRTPGLDRKTVSDVLHEFECRGLDPVQLGLAPETSTTHEVETHRRGRAPNGAQDSDAPRPLGAPETTPDGSGSVAQSGQLSRVTDSPRGLRTREETVHAGPDSVHRPPWLRRLDLGITLLVFMVILLADPEFLTKPVVFIPLTLSLAVSLLRSVLPRLSGRTLAGRAVDSPLARFASWWSPVLVSILLAAVAFSALYQLFSYKPSPEKWPQSFTLSASDHQGVGVYPKFTEDRLLDMLGTYGFCFGQGYSLGVIEAKFPDLSREVVRVRWAFDRRFSESARKIDEILSEIDKGLPVSVLDNIRTNSRQMLDGQSITRYVAVDFLKQVEARSKGDIPSPYLETLLLYHPTYAENPAQEYLDGFGRRFTSDGTGKALGLRISLKFPTSWSDTEGERPHILRKFLDRRQGRAMALIYVQDLGELPEDLAANDLGDLSRQEWMEIVDMGFSAEMIKKNLPFEDAIVHDQGLCNLAGVPSKWVEFSGSRHLADQAWLAQRCVVFYLIYEGRCISLQFFASDVGTTDLPPDPRPAFDLYGPLFFQMAQSFDIFNRYEE